MRFGLVRRFLVSANYDFSDLAVSKFETKDYPFYYSLPCRDPVVLYYEYYHNIKQAGGTLNKVLIVAGRRTASRAKGVCKAFAKRMCDFTCFCEYVCIDICDCAYLG